MPGTLNKVMLIGHLGDDVKMHYFEGGNCIGRFSIATNEVYTNKSGERITNTEWHNLITRNKLAENCEKYLKKGDKIYIEGRLKTRQWQDEAGNKRYNTDIQVDELKFLTPKRADSNQTTSQANTETAKSKESASKKNDLNEENLPF